MKTAYHRPFWLLAFVGSLVVAAGLVACRPRQSPGGSVAASTNAAVKLVEVQWIVQTPTRVRPVAFGEDVEAAERINQQLMKRYREAWERNRGLPQ